MTLPLKNQRVLILGGSGQMGSATARAVQDLGADVILAGRSETRLLSVAKTLTGDARIIVADLSETEAVVEVIAQAEADHIVVALSANASAADIPGTPLGEAQRAFTRFWASFAALKTAAALRSKGSVTLLSGSSARMPAPRLRCLEHASRRDRGACARGHARAGSHQGECCLPGRDRHDA